MTSQNVFELRAEIDRLDQNILELLDRRAVCAREIGRLKSGGGKPAFDPGRERDLLARLCRDDHTLSTDALRRIYIEIISACRSLQAPLRVAYLGPEATFSHRAALGHFGGAADFAPQTTVHHVFREVEAGQADFGVVPVENSTEGAVGLTLDELVISDLSVCGEIYLPVVQNLLSRENDKTTVKTVYSHPQALAQCRSWLAANLPAASLVEASSTASAAERATREPGTAAIGADMLAEKHGLGILAAGIQDLALNQTRFFVLGRLACETSGRDKTSIIFILSHEPGSLSRALNPLAEAGINMTRIESRPVKAQAWEYVFFVDIEGHRSEEKVRNALEKMAAEVETLKILGSYPAGDAAGQCSNQRTLASGGSQSA
ncbi:MAG: prephenate dehydratase [Proteobacteria bacterium]|nr:prephenate dehydratase [Pseudomonadota bacterium]